jgi:hypothetical protein
VADPDLRPLCRVRQSLIEQEAHMIVREAVDRTLPVAPECDEVAVPEQAKLMAGRRLGHAGYGGKVADAELLYRERLQDAKTRQVGERREHVDGPPFESVMCQLGRHTTNGGFVDDADEAGPDFVVSVGHDVI